jgi:hypothetical protein
MSNTTSFPRNAAGKLFFVSGLTGGREVFLGKAVDEPFQEHLTLEGKVLSATPDGRMVVRPFQTTVNFALHEAGYSVQHITNAAAHEEASKLLELAATHVSRTAYPYVFRWVEAAVQQVAPGPANESAGQALVPHGADPFLGLYQGFRSTAEEFRRVLFQSHQIETTSELDRVTELEGDLLIEIGKITNQAAVKFNQILVRDRGLSSYFAAIMVSGLPLGGAGHSMSGWPFLFERVQIAKVWARRNGKAALVRDVNTIIKDGLFGLSEVILEHSNSLDTLITETFGQYGITDELVVKPEPSRGLPAPRSAPMVIGGTVLPLGG